MTITDPKTTQTETASEVLAAFVRSQALQTMQDVGFGWRGSAGAPSTYQQLRAAYSNSAFSGEALPVSNEFCEHSIYPEPADNIAFRFWHDASHIRQGLSFDLEDELELALWHLGVLELHGYEKGSEVYRLFEADLVGQVLLFALIRRFPFDQQAFVQTAQSQGLLPGVLAEIRRVS